MQELEKDGLTQMQFVEMVFGNLPMVAILGHNLLQLHFQQVTTLTTYRRLWLIMQELYLQLVEVLDIVTEVG